MNRLDTRRVLGRDRMDFWLDAVCRNILRAAIDPRADTEPEAALESSLFGPLGIRRVAGGAHVYQRRTSDVRVDDPESVLLGIPTRGTSILVQDGREAVLSPGDLVLYDSSRPFTLAMDERYHWHVFLLSKAKLRRPDAELSKVTAVPMKAERGIPAVVSRYLLDLSARCGEFVERSAAEATLGETASDLISTLVCTELDQPWVVEEPAEVLRQQVLHEMATRHHETALGPAALADAVGVSVRTLHQLFADSGASVMERLRDHRLAQARRDLADRRHAPRTVAAISAAHGFRSQAVFARAFRAAYGMTASEFRAAALVAGDDPG